MTEDQDLQNDVSNCVKHTTETLSAVVGMLAVNTEPKLIIEYIEGRMLILTKKVDVLIAQDRREKEQK